MELHNTLMHSTLPRSRSGLDVKPDCCTCSQGQALEQSRFDTDAEIYNLVELFAICCRYLGYLATRAKLNAVDYCRKTVLKMSICQCE